MKIGVVDYDAGNLRSVETALRYCGIDFFVTDDPEKLQAADKIVFPGVGEARAAMEVLTKKGLTDAVLSLIRSGKPFLGICIGYQILFERSEERDTACLGVIPGTVKRFPENAGFKVPHMGWNEVRFGEAGRNTLFAGIPQNSSFYFVHSYYPSPASEDTTLGSSEYIIPFASCYRKENVTAVQFHPEKSGKAGLQLLRNFAGAKR